MGHRILTKNRWSDYNRYNNGSVVEVYMKRTVNSNKEGIRGLFGP